ncbi:MAG: methyltransferase domain-containing protein [Thermoleophilaceae bacterium]|nr:methyltransferase domain-containing protein [Thermoleophilaceae bacterium]
MAFEDLKQKQSVMWGSGPYQGVSDHLAPAHDHLMRAIEPAADERWLDLATGTGEIAIRAALGGAEVTGLDLAPDLIQTAGTRATAAGATVVFEVGDAESLPYGDASFDTVTSSFGVMFAPDHSAVAAELARVCRPGGRLGLLTWHPTEGVADFFKIMAPYQPAPPEGVGSPFTWGDRDHLEELLGDSFELSYETGDAPQAGPSAEAVWDLFSAEYGPTKTLADSLDDDRRAALKADWVAYFEQFPSGDGVSQPRPYLVVVGTRR